MDKDEKLNKRMKEPKLTKEYLKTLGKVYNEQGLIAAIGYEIKSTLYSLDMRIENFLDSKPSAAEEIHDLQTLAYLESEGNYAFKPSKDLGEQAWHEKSNRIARDQNRTAKRKEYILRGI